MLTKIINGNTFGFLEVEKASSDFWVDKDSLFYLWEYGNGDGLDEAYLHITLPSGNWQIIGKVNELSEDALAHLPFDKDLADEYGFINATEAWYFLIASIGMNPDNCLILKQVK